MNGIGVINAPGHPAIASSLHTLVVQTFSFCNLDMRCSRPGWDY